MEILSAFIDCEADSAIDFSPLFPSVPLTLTKLFARQQRESAEKWWDFNNEERGDGKCVLRALNGS